VAIARYYFYPVTGAVAPLLNLTNTGSDATNKVAASGNPVVLPPNHRCARVIFVESESQALRVRVE